MKSHPPPPQDHLKSDRYKSHSIHHGIVLPDVYTPQALDDFIKRTDTMLQKAIDILASPSN